MHPDKMKICVIGLGYIGLPTAALLASRGFSVAGVDSNPEVVAKVNQGRVHIVENDLPELVARVVTNGTLKAGPDPELADVFLIAVPTPLSEEKAPVLDHVFAAAEALAPHLRPGSLVIIESTSPVGTTERVCDRLAELRSDLRFPHTDDPMHDADIAMAYCPERVLPGHILRELVENDRSVGGVTPACAQKAQGFYKSFVDGECIVTSARMAEMVKLTENSYRDLNIGFANELSLICDELKIDVWELIALANRHPRVDILRPGPGVGGHCIAVDPWFLVHAAPGQARLIRTAREVNDAKTEYVIDKVSDLIARHPSRPVACLGLSFKANVDDLRESPALKLVERLAGKHGSKIRVVEPFIEKLPEKLENLKVQQMSLDAVLEENGIIVILVDHDQFRQTPQEKYSGSIVCDTRGIWAEIGSGLGSQEALSGLSRRRVAA
jgi:UDP-N-acetyl-D-mannosaminuronic acid dehydrogenase